MTIELAPGDTPRDLLVFNPRIRDPGKLALNHGLAKSSNTGRHPELQRESQFRERREQAPTAGADHVSSSRQMRVAIGFQNDRCQATGYTFLAPGMDIALKLPAGDCKSGSSDDRDHDGLK
jgi:hypothetical protein